MTISKTERDALLAQFLNDYLFDQSEPTHGEEMTSLIMSAVDARVKAALVKALPVEEKTSGPDRADATTGERRPVADGSATPACAPEEPAFSTQLDFAAMAEELHEALDDHDQHTSLRNAELRASEPAVTADWLRANAHRLSPSPPAPAERDESWWLAIAARCVTEYKAKATESTMVGVLAASELLRSTFAAPVAQPAPAERNDTWWRTQSEFICRITARKDVETFLRKTFAAPVAFDVEAAIKVVHEMQDASRAVLELGDIPSGAKGWLKDKRKAALEWLAVAKQMGVR